MINAVNLLPVGRTDGGRISLTLFGRSGTQLVSLAAFIFIFIQGLTGSDVLLFFFSFVIFFQSELEIPQRNEVDDMDFSRVLLATATGVLVLLTLIPM
jgi:membrane-associated protease RseP (regulator of RpoE activity)